MDKQKIRVGIIRCDLHGIYYANVMQAHDPFVLRDPKYGMGSYYYFYSQYNDPERMTLSSSAGTAAGYVTPIPMVEGFEVTRVWDADRQLAQNMTKIYNSRPAVCDTFEEVSDDVDLVLIANCSFEGDDHLELASPGIAKGVPTFLDKPFAFELSDARALVDLAQTHQVPIMSLSVMRELPQATLFRNRFVELNHPTFGTVKVGAEPPDRDNLYPSNPGLYLLAGLVHGISLAQHLFGAGVESVEAMGGDKMPSILHLDYGGKPGRPESGVVINAGVGPTFHCSLYASAYSELGSIHTDHMSDYEFPWGFVKVVEMIKEMVQTQQPQAPYEEMIECIAIGAAARRSLTERRRVYLKELE